MSRINAYADVVEVCAFLQIFGFKITSLEKTDVSNEEIGTVVINCQAPVFHVVMESDTKYAWKQREPAALQM